MGTMNKIVRNKVKAQRKPSNSSKATVNRAGGVAFEVSDPALKLVTMVGGAFFAEPRFYNADACIPKRVSGGKFSKLVERIQLVDDKLKGFASCEELDDTAKEVMATIVDVANSGNPEDLMAIANWLRNEMNIRLTPQVILVLASKIDATKGFVREYAPFIIKRPDEVKNILLLHRFFFGMKSLSNGLNMGLGDAVSRFGERGLMKYEGASFPSWKDVLCWIKRKKGWPLEDAVAKYFITGKVVDSDKTPIVAARKALSVLSDFSDERARELAKTSLVNWEVLLSQFPKQKKDVWEFLIDERLLGYMATMRNLRNILQAGVSHECVEKVASFLSNEKAVLNSKQLPFRFLSALKSIDIYDDNIDSVDRNVLAEAVEQAADYACSNVSLPGVTAVFADASGSMTSCNVSARSSVTCADAASVLCGIVAKSAEKPYVFGFATDTKVINYTKNDTVLGIAGKMPHGGIGGHNTNAWKIPLLLKEKGIYPDRVIILSDMQCWDDTSMAGSGGWHARSRSEQKAVCDTWADYVASSKDAKKTWLHCIHLNGSGDAIVDEGSQTNQLAGFSEKVFNMLARTEGGEGDPLPTVEQIRDGWTVRELVEQ